MLYNLNALCCGRMREKERNLGDSSSSPVGKGNSISVVGKLSYGFCKRSHRE